MSKKKVFSDNQIQIFESIVKMDQKMLKKTLGKFLRKEYKKVIETKEFIYAEGDIPVALVSHMDTVFKKQPVDVFYDKHKCVMWSPEGLGADDRAGVFMIMSIIKSGLKPHIIFTTDEEIGGVGAKALSKCENPFKDLRYVIQLDRRGVNDCVFYDCDNKDFVEYVEGFGFVETWGSFSDISYLCPAWEVAGVNLSVGYKNEHSAIETLHTNAWFATFEKVKVMLQEEEIPSFKYIPYVYNYSGSGYSNADWWRFAYDYDYDDFELYPMEGSGKTDSCNFCSTIEDTNNLLYVKNNDGTLIPVCYDCLRDKVSWCDMCDEPFIIDPEDEEVKFYCPSCMEKLEAYGTY